MCVTWRVSFSGVFSSDLSGKNRRAEVGLKSAESEETKYCYSPAGDGKSEIPPWIAVVEDSGGKFASTKMIRL